MQHARMTFPAPRNMGVGGPFWTVDGVREYLSIGGWFIKGSHNFANVEAARAAGIKEADSTPQPKRSNMSAEQRLIDAAARLSNQERSELLERLGQ